MRMILFVAAAYFLGFGFLILSCWDLYEKSQFWFDNETGFMESTDPYIAKALKYSDHKSLIKASVTYRSATGTFTLPDKYLYYNEAQRLNAGEKIPIRFKKSNPYWSLQEGEHLNPDWFGIIVAMVFIPLALLSHYLLRKEYTNLQNAAQQGVQADRP